MVEAALALTVNVRSCDTLVLRVRGLKSYVEITCDVEWFRLGRTPRGYPRVAV